ncbi:enoyl-CoA hydratase/isomerase family protein [Metabacillus idriensis]|uniref:enoyl-CoA hydratase/isomerase family protein n=1 Tax=Metabacillus idriensis TaxID=324768 RepID=UPI0017492BA7|nr:enoyl-CoA hydratase [Metabacillus idriensis]
MNMSDLLVEKNGSVLLLTLNRPDRLNAFSAEMIHSLTKEINNAKQDDSVRAVVLSGSGRSFSAGGDVKTMGEANGQHVYDHIGRLNECINAFSTLEKPIIAAVHGFAAGAAFNLALACDQILAAVDSKFVMSFSQVGLISDGGGLYFLPRIIGPYKAKQLFFNAEPITANQALEYGIVNKTVPAEQLKDEAISYAHKLSQGPIKAYGMMKKIINSSATSNLDEILEQERIAQTLMISTEDHQEGIHAFKDKRKPVFQGK